jgi:hypothetical protein
MSTPFRVRHAVACLALAFASHATHAAVTLIESGRAAEWRYLDHNQRPPAGWVEPDFDDGMWPAGGAPLGFGEPDITTRVRFGPSAQAVAPTTYFRHHFTVTALEGLQTAALFLRVDDGAVVYLNGREIGRVNLPAGAISHATLTLQAIGGEAEKLYHTVAVPISGFVIGANLLAVEVHQCNGVSTDLFLDLRLRAYASEEKPGADDIPGAAAESGDAAAAGLAALQRGNVTRGFELLNGLPEDHPRFTATMLQAGELLAGKAGRPDLGRDLVARAYRRNPDSEAVAYGWARAQLLAQTNLQVPAAPRAYPAKVPEQWAWITAGPHFPDRSRQFPRAKLEADLDYLETMTANAYSYAGRRGVDWRQALDAIRVSLGEQTGLATFGFRLMRYLTIFGDPHSRLQSATFTRPRGYLPFIPEPVAGNRVLAVQLDRSGFVSDAHPYLAALDGHPLSEWVEQTAHDVPQSSPQYQWRGQVGGLVYLNYLRGELTFPLAPEVQVTLASADGARTRNDNLGVAANFRAAPRLPKDSHSIKDGIGYLRIQSMLGDQKFIAGLNAAMRDLRETRGLVIDVRGNGGGTQDALRALMPYFLPPGGPLQIVNVAAYLIPAKFDHMPREGFLPAGRHLRPTTASVWSAADRVELERFLAGFKPEWQPPGAFSGWHVMGIRHETNPRAFHYEAPVVVLCDAGCFSATDNFLGALQGQPHVTLMGTTSGGGSGRMAEYTLPNSRLAMTLCQMASFRANGRLYEGAGVQPDVALEAKPSDFLAGGGDSVLEAAVSRLRKGEGIGGSKGK